METLFDIRTFASSAVKQNHPTAQAELTGLFNDAA
jgi:hypothetical protein